MPVRKVTVIIATLALCVVSSACSSRFRPPEAARPTQLESIAAAAYHRTTEAKSSRIWIEVVFRGIPTIAGDQIPGIGQGVFDYETHRGKLTFSGPSSAQSFTILMDGTTVYFKAPSGTVPGSKPWVKVDLPDAESLGSLGSAGSNSLSNDPSQALSFLLGASQSFTLIGSERVRGVATKHYHLLLDLNRAATQLPSDRQANYRKMIENLGTTTIPADVWIDARGLIRRMQLNNIPLGSAGDRSPNSSIDETIELYDFGVSVNVTPPPASEVTNLSSLLSSPSP
jgi:hypothetical protein